MPAYFDTLNQRWLTSTPEDEAKSKAACTECFGEGVLWDSRRGDDDEWDDFSFDCEACGGTGRRKGSQ